MNKTVDDILIKNPVICLKFIFAFIKFRQIESDHIVFSFGGPRGLHLKILFFFKDFLEFRIKLNQSIFEYYLWFLNYIMASEFHRVRGPRTRSKLRRTTEQSHDPETGPWVVYRNSNITKILLVFYWLQFDRSIAYAI